MKKLFTLFVLFSFALTTTQAQNYIGLRSDDYNGVLGVGINPANAVSSKYRMDLNLFGVGASIGTDYTPLSIGSFDLTENTKDFNNAYANLEFYAPSVLISLNERNGIAISIRNRTMVRATDISQDLLSGKLFDDVSDPTGIETLNLHGDLMTNMFNEIDLTYATSIVKTENHTFTIGATLKILKHVGDFWVSADKLELTKTEDPITGDLGLETDGSLAIGYPSVLSGELDTDKVLDSYMDNLTNFSNLNFGFDIGFSYQFKPDGHPRAYKFKIDAAIVDIGKVTSASSKAKILESSTYPVDPTKITQVDQIKDIDNLNLIFENSTDLETYKISLPRALNLNVDYNIGSKFYLAAWASLDMLKDDGDISSPHAINTYAVVPRWEAKYFGLSVPYVMNELGNKYLGVGMRLGPIYLGSSSILSSLMSDSVKNADFYIGMRIPVYKRKQVVEELPVEETL